MEEKLFEEFKNLLKKKSKEDKELISKAFHLGKRVGYLQVVDHLDRIVEVCREGGDMDDYSFAPYDELDGG